MDDYARLDSISEQLYFSYSEKKDRNDNTYYVRSIKELNPMIFNWLDVLDINVVVILVLMMAVAGFTMISGLLIIILERTKTLIHTKTKPVPIQKQKQKKNYNPLPLRGAGR